MGPNAEEDVDDEEAGEVDYSQYDRENRSDDEEDTQEQGVLLADSDSD